MKEATIKIPSRNTLYKEFIMFANAKENDVRGILTFDSGRPGPTVGITVMTHGNEPCGLAAAHYLRTTFDLQKRLVRGKVVIVLNNIDATYRYFEALKLRDKQRQAKAKSAARFVDMNMNRMPAYTLVESHFTDSDLSYEMRRARDLQDVWKTFDVALDIHSTSQKMEPVIIACDNLHPDLILGFPIKKIITKIVDYQLNKPAVYFYGETKTPKVAIEAGWHEEPKAFSCAIQCAITFLENTGVIPGPSVRERQTFDVFEIQGSVFFPTDMYKLRKVYKPFVEVTKGEVLARGPGVDIVAAFDGHAIMAPPTKKPSNLQEEVMFLATKAKQINF